MRFVDIPHLFFFKSGRVGKNFNTLFAFLCFSQFFAFFCIAIFEVLICIFFLCPSPSDTSVLEGT